MSLCVCVCACMHVCVCTWLLCNSVHSVLCTMTNIHICVFVCAINKNKISYIVFIFEALVTESAKFHLMLGYTRINCHYFLKIRANIIFGSAISSIAVIVPSCCCNEFHTHSPLTSLAACPNLNIVFVALLPVTECDRDIFLPPIISLYETNAELTKHGLM